MPLSRTVLRPAFKGILSNHQFALGVAANSETLTPAKWLSPSERKLRNQFQSEKRRHNFLLGRVAAKRSAAALGEKAPPTAASILPGVFGQPVWIASPWHTSITHSSTLAFAASALELPLTLDLETLDATALKRAQSLHKRLTPNEKRLMPHHPAAFLSLWSAKECLGKMLRVGISVAPSVLEISAVDSKGACREILFASFPQVKVSQWEFAGWLFSLLTPNEAKIPGEMVAWLGSWLLVD